MDQVILVQLNKDIINGLYEKTLQQDMNFTGHRNNKAMKFYE